MKRQNEFIEKNESAAEKESVGKKEYAGQGQKEYVEQNKNRLCNINSFAILGLDLKITPEGLVKVIEINGSDAGMTGFELAFVGEEVIPRRQESFAPVHKNRHFRTNLCQERLHDHLRTYGCSNLHRIKIALANNFMQSNQLMMLETSLNNVVDCAGLNNGTGVLIDRFIAFEKILADKLEIDCLFNEAREWKPLTRSYNRNSLRLAGNESSYVVIKPQRGQWGEGLVILSSDSIDSLDLLDSHDSSVILHPSAIPFSLESYVCEPFVQSRQIMSTKTGQMHDGCMRYVVLAEEDREGAVNVFHYGGYWRLAPRPLTDVPHIDAMRANLKQGALVEQVSAENLQLVKSAVDEFIPKFYSQLLRKTDGVFIH